jgi:hypothetical protein
MIRMIGREIRMGVESMRGKIGREIRMGVESMRGKIRRVTASEGILMGERCGDEG